MLFSVVTVCLNPGTELDPTIASILEQDFGDYEILIKDGASRDGTQRRTWLDSRVRLVSAPDRGIYSAMNQALRLCRGTYVYFLNTGDTFFDSEVLTRLAPLLQAPPRQPDILYCDIFNVRLGAATRYPPRLSPWALYRRPVCHQALFVKRSCFDLWGGFDETLKVSADYELLLRFVLREHASVGRATLVAARYKDDGFSSSASTVTVKSAEAREIRRRHFTGRQRLLFGALWSATFPGLRIRLVRSNRHPLLRRLYVRLANWAGSAAP